jgi:hypothetical protein
MSTALAIAGVTQVLRDLLNDRFVNENVAGQIGQSVTVSTLPPDKVVQQNGVEVTQLNVFLRHVTPNIGWRNEGLPSRDNSGRNRLSNPPLALDLHYLVSAYGAADLHAEILLGYAMQMLHEAPFITREQIRRAINPAPDAANVLPDWLRALRDSGLENQLEQLKITPEYLSTEEMSKFWTSTLAHYRPSAAYQVSVVLIQAQQPAPLPLPVLTRHIGARSEVAPSVPTLVRVEPDAGQSTVEMGKTVKLEGFALDGTQQKVVLTNDRFAIELDIDPAGGNSREVRFTIDGSLAAQLPAGMYQVAVRVKRPDDSQVRISNRLPLALAPKPLNLPLSIPAPGGAASITVNLQPQARAGQTIRLVLGNTEYASEPITATTSQVAFAITGAKPGEYLTRVRVDGVDSHIIKADDTVPAYLPDRRIQIQ